MPLGFTNNLRSILNVYKVLNNKINEDSAVLFEDAYNVYILNKITLMLWYWTFELLEVD